MSSSEITKPSLSMAQNQGFKSDESKRFIKQGLGVRKVLKFPKTQLQFWGLTWVKFPFPKELFWNLGKVPKERKNFKRISGPGKGSVPIQALGFLG